MARPTLTDEDKAMRATLRKGRSTQPAIRVPAGVPTPPADLNADALPYWHAFAGDLAALGNLAPAYSQALAAASRARADVAALSNVVAERGYFYEARTASGAILYRVHPAVGLLRSAEQHLRGWLHELGLTVAGRARLHTSDLRLPPTKMPSPRGREPHEMTGTADDFFPVD
jgi:P27 family predicted phage terminase small subunit